MSIENNLKQIYQRMGKAAEGASRGLQEIKLLAVSKTMKVEAVREAYQAGQRVFAENRVQEWLEKAPALPKDCEWHLIGRLQTNKVKYLNDNITLIHSLDRLNLLKTLEEQGTRRDIIWPVLVEVNTARDPDKAGLMREELEDFLNAIADCSHVQAFGLMTIGALEATPEETQGFFRELHQIRDVLQKKKIPHVNLDELSMGMSRDFELAIAEGATIVRVGRQIFGDRQAMNKPANI
ncbi:YggS family pyridoxal phosphate-dependent enzyme [Desulfitobacterium metallireducens]|uniref:Pyridoxal phosphate homeostasis protein n=1 Tax=Desulfitobacterium metallireducens DSM 15288 TaxID=871968 RepID=W0EAD2_9FIRM|nr:YggS family pyridoxal phosphate-dependent enzyme [Desulfitobacterium metallireducens]AHF07702.1 pyridoxal phosphate biosynthesis protein [Desulfitobacterium metallireducens DSM 15288]